MERVCLSRESQLEAMCGQLVYGQLKRRSKRVTSICQRLISPSFYDHPMRMREREGEEREEADHILIFKYHSQLLIVERELP